MNEKEKKLDDLDAFIDNMLFEEYVKLLEGDIGQCTCQLFKQDSGECTRPFASGVFIRLGNDYYLLTASHVIEDWSDNNRLFVEIENGFVSIVGKGCGTELEKGHRLDAAYIKLKPELIPVLIPWYKFLPYDRCLFQHEVVDPNYCVYGYPVINQRNEERLKSLHPAIS